MGGYLTDTMKPELSAVSAVLDLSWEEAFLNAYPSTGDFGVAGAKVFVPTVVVA